MRTNRLLIALIVSVLSCHPVYPQEQKPPNRPPTTGAGGRAADPTFRVVRSVSGTKILDQGGRYTVEDPRTVFYAPADKQVN